MKIAFLARCLTHGAGVGRYARCLLRAMGNIAAADLVLLSNKELPGLDASLEIRNSNCANFLSILKWEQLDVPRIIRREGIDVLFNPDFVLPFHCPCPGVVTVHDVSYAAMPGCAGLRARLYYGTFVARSVRKAHTVVTVSEFSKRAIRDHFGIDEKQITVAYPAADAKFHPSYDPADVRLVRRKYNIEGDYILYVGLLGGWKNVEGLLEAYDIVRSKVHTHCDLVLAGRTCPATRKIVRAAERLQLGECLHILPNVDDGDLPLLYNGARVFAFPSLYEGFGLPPLEAMCCGVPVVCTNAGALPEVTADAALRVAPGNVEELAEALLEVLDSQQLRNDLIQNGFRRVRAFSWEKCAKRILKIFHEAAG
ncbi:MAG: glycosyltransferase family 4 protein [Planctomycetes bacterium]|nr:glycosyltransferase family 4 protein [Planctomycetota bacterium]